jgi:hypothetical protein
MPYEVGFRGDLIASHNLRTWINTLRSGYETDFPNGCPSLDCYLRTMAIVLAAFIESEWRETGRNDAALNLRMRRRNFDKAIDADHRRLAMYDILDLMADQVPALLFRQSASYFRTAVSKDRGRFFQLR